MGGAGELLKKTNAADQAYRQHAGGNQAVAAAIVADSTKRFGIKVPAYVAGSLDVVIFKLLRSQADFQDKRHERNLQEFLTQSGVQSDQLRGVMDAIYSSITQAFRESVLAR